MGVLLEPIDSRALERAAQGLMTLTQSEYLVLRALFAGLSSNEIAAETGLTKLTVQFYLKTIFKKCGCDRLSLARMAAKLEQVSGVARHLAALDIMAGQTHLKRAPVLSGRHSAPTHPVADVASVVSLKTRARSVDRRPFKPRRKLAKSA